MHPARIAELLQPFLGSRHSDEHGDEGFAVLSPGQLQSISTYIDILLRWNTRINLTAIRDPEEIVTRHFGESLFAARMLYPVSSRPPVVKVAGSIADVGSGAGFPGIPIKLWQPDLQVTLIESNQKKATFLREIARALTLTSIDIQSARAETLPARQFDMVTLRAVERFETILPVAASLVHPEGRLALLIGSAQQTQAQAALPGTTWQQPSPIPASTSRILLIGSPSQNQRG